MEYPQTIEMVFTGYCTLQGGKPGAVLMPINADGKVEKEAIFERKSLKHYVVGGVYSIEQASENSYS